MREWHADFSEEDELEVEGGVTCVLAAMEES